MKGFYWESRFSALYKPMLISLQMVVGLWTLDYLCSSPHPPLSHFVKLDCGQTRVELYNGKGVATSKPSVESNALRFENPRPPHHRCRYLLWLTHLDQSIAKSEVCACAEISKNSDRCQVFWHAHTTCSNEGQNRCISQHIAGLLAAAASMDIPKTFWPLIN